MKILLLGLVLLAPLHAAARTEIGEINGARFRIDVPEKWNGGLIVYCHGYSDSPGNYENKPNPAAGANQ